MSRNPRHSKPRRTKAPARSHGEAARLRWVVASSLVIAAAALAAYANSFSGPFIFDDRWTILDNATIRNLWSLDVVCPPAELTVAGRPLVNLSLAVNYALGGTNVWGYHAFNLAVHALAALALFGVVRRTLLLPSLRGRFGDSAAPMALAATLVWEMHPLQTESVAYIVQRAESMVSAFYLSTLYCFVRGTQSPDRARRWFAASVGACLFGMASKEVMASAPLVVILFDRTFVSGSFREAWRRRRWVHLSLCGTWLLLASLVAGAGDRGETAGFGAGVAWGSYALTQCGAIIHYLRLVAWPSPLVLDYGTDLVKDAAEVGWQAAMLAALIFATAIGLWRRPKLGFLGAAFFAILAPSSSVVPVATQTMAEHRMYLALAAPVVLAVLALHSLTGRRAVGVLAVCAIWAAVLGALTARRNLDYRSALEIWTDTAAKRPNSARAQCNIGLALYDLGRTEEAIGRYEEAARLAPDNTEYRINLGIAHVQQDNLQEAERQFRTAAQMDPDSLLARLDLGNVLVALGRGREGLAELTRACEIAPGDADVRLSLGIALAELGRLDEAVAEFEKSLDIAPQGEIAHENLADALVRLGRLDEAALHYREAVRLNPDNAAARGKLNRRGAVR